MSNLAMYLLLVITLTGCQVGESVSEIRNQQELKELKDSVSSLREALTRLRNYTENKDSAEKLIKRLKSLGFSAHYMSDGRIYIRQGPIDYLVTLSEAKAFLYDEETK